MVMLPEDIIGDMDKRDDAREHSLRLSREVIRLCSTAIKSIHRGEIEEADELIARARSVIDEIDEVLEDYPSIYYGGFVFNALQEYAETMIVRSVLTGGDIPKPELVDVDVVAYLNGLADSVGEMRRRVLDLLRENRIGEAGPLLDLMDEVYLFLLQFDYPDALTPGLRRKVDVARGLVERTRGDLTTAIILRQKT